MQEAFETRNVSEELVDMYLSSCIKKTDMCKCERCKADIRAFALNSFPPHYVVTDFGEAMTKVLSLSVQFQADIITAIMKGIVIVRDNPRHPPEEIVK
ncbi:MAG: late competence development ComFB family protein [Oscillospiraceae bacterium]|nr:late competence development ComFB family protein [Oscillospiraceae bacterium]